MVKAKQLSSGSWRCQVFDYQDENGKRHYKSFTAPTRREAEDMASDFQFAVKKRSYAVDRTLTAGQAVNRYIRAKTGVLSPATIRGYKAIERNYIENIKDKQIHALTSYDMQLFISEVSQKVKPKTVANVYGLMYSSILMFRPDAVFRVTLPKKPKYKQKTPSDREVVALFNAATPEMKLCIGLAAFGSLRRGEICALKHSDIDGNKVYVHADIIRGADSKYMYKEIPKTSDSIRTVTLPAEVIKLIPRGAPDDYIVKLMPDHVTYRFKKLRNKLGIRIRFHDLRGYFASIGAALGVPDVYMSDFGGWRRNSSVLKEVYQNVIETEEEKYSGRMTNHFDGLITGVMQHEIPNATRKNAAVQ